MDDPIFDPWCLESAPATPSTSPRWRQRGPVPPPTPPKQSFSRGPRLVGSAEAHTRRRLSGTPGFLRSMAVPRLRDTVNRLVMARHHARLEDRLDETPPTILLEMSSWQGPLEDEGPTVSGRLEVGIEEGPEERVVVRSLWQSPAGEQTAVDTIPVSKVGVTWLEGHILRLVEVILKRS